MLSTRIPPSFYCRDGWTPKEFKSSRKKDGDEGGEGDRPGRRHQTANDFMDDEDRGHFGIAPQKLQASRKFRTPDLPGSSGGGRRGLAGLADIFGPDEGAGWVIFEFGALLGFPKNS